jgi:ADP-ribosyl-[dinitrogen reductase] hydrolase
MTNLQDRAAGAFIGLALGDALGAPFVGRRAREIPAELPLPRRGTDATWLAADLVGSLSERRGFDEKDFLGRLLGSGRRLDIDPITWSVLSRVAAGDSDAARSYFLERGPEVSAGNGSVKRCAPLGAAFAGRPDHLLQAAPSMSAITHWDERCRTACLAMTLAVASLVRGEDPNRSVVSAVEACYGREGAEELEELVDGAGLLRPIDGPDRNFCFFTAGAGLRIAALAGSFQDGCEKVVRLGGDTAANGAVTGALLGAREGWAALPSGWLGAMEHTSMLEREARSLAALAMALSDGT